MMDLKAILRAKIAAVTAAKTKTPLGQPRKPAAAPGERVWRNLHRVMRVGEQQCRCCGGTSRFIAGEYAYQKSGTVLRTILIGHLPGTEAATILAMPATVEQLPAEIVDFCPKCLGVGEETLDALLEQLGQSRNLPQTSLWG